MSFLLTSKQYMEYMERAAQKIAISGEYISALDAATGDGDHWVNLNMGFIKILESKDALAELDIAPCFKQIGMIMMNTIGGSSGVLYGGAYMAAAKVISTPAIDARGLCDALASMANDMMKRGKSEPGYKTMIDALYPASEAYREALNQNFSDRKALEAMKAAALDGAESTKAMKAFRGRASYQPDKGVGHLDPGAVTMSYQLEVLADYIIEEVL